MAGAREGSTQPPKSAVLTSLGAGRARCSRAAACRCGGGADRSARGSAAARGEAAGAADEAAAGFVPGLWVTGGAVAGAAATLGDGAGAASKFALALVVFAAGTLRLSACPAGNWAGALLPVRMYRLHAMNPIIATSPAMPNLTQKPALLAGAAVSDDGLECTVRGASKRLSPFAPRTAGAIESAASGPIEGSAPRRAAQASQKRAAARFSRPQAGQAIVEDLALNIALHCA